MTSEIRIDALSKAGDLLRKHLDNPAPILDAVLRRAQEANGWFDIFHTRYALERVADMLRKDMLEAWLSQYNTGNFTGKSPARIGVVMAGNIPLVGFHDFLCVLAAGHRCIAKLSAQDTVLWQYIRTVFDEAAPALADRLVFADNLRDGFDAVIATGSDNTSRYFEYYFGRYPHIIRRNRNSTAILNGHETAEELNALAGDICLYYGRGCRSVSLIYVPQGYTMSPLFEALNTYSHYTRHNKYFNNYEYRKAIMMLNNIPFEDTGFMILSEDASYASPVAILHYAYYDDPSELKEKLINDTPDLQCIVSIMPEFSGSIKPGLAQSPALSDYADGVDTMKFLLETGF